MTIPQKGDSDSRGLRPKRLKEPTPGESDSDFFISRIGTNKTPTPRGTPGKKVKRADSRGIRLLESSRFYVIAEVLDEARENANE